MVRHLKRMFTGGLLVAAGVGFILTAAGRLSGNIGWLKFSGQLTAIMPNLPGYPPYQVIDQTAIQSSQAWLRRAMALNSGDRVARWNLGRMALATGDAETAVKWLEPLADETQANGLLNLDRLAALSLTGRFDEVLTISAKQPLVNQLLSKPVRAALDAQATTYLQTGGSGALEKARVLRPTDLYVNFRLWEQARSAGDEPAIDAYRQAIVRFAREAVDPADERVLDYVATAVPELRANGLWDHEQVWRVAAFLVWQHATATSVEDLLKALTARYPNEVVWPELLLEQQSRQAGQSLAQGNLDISENERTDRQFAAEQLGVRVEQIQLGTNLVENDRFDRWIENAPDDWRVQTYLGNQASNGLYVFGGDSFHSDGLAARIDGLWGGDLSDGSKTYAEYVGNSFAITDGPYLVSISFRTHYSDGGGVVFISDYSTINGFILAYQNLLETHGQRQLIQLIVRGPARSQTVTPVLRNWGLGTMWIDSISVRQVTCPATVCQ